MAKIKVTQRRSVIKIPRRQRLTMASLGLRHINHSVEHEDNPVIKGMIRKVAHLVEVESID